ncbi:hypothetical protein G6Z92_06140 [Vibrio aestuarianus subsp. cardii]|uniref:hypothetical protein n=1 Tax=Vibrio aestuarianus TaxID=28171 RepID=UPI0015C543CE|nr:hypothetical protein [Vibrio aestuarianus]NGZ66565.1 hypothetical protein [Vibrio aestuarianus subsp. cardii]
MINTTNELISFQMEFDGQISLNEATDIASKPVIEAARRLAQTSTDTHSIVIPNNVETIWAGDGSGEWVPALVFVPNEEIQRSNEPLTKE